MNPILFSGQGFTKKGTEKDLALGIANPENLHIAPLSRQGKLFSCSFSTNWLISMQDPSFRY